MITNNEFDEMERIVDQVNDVSKTDREREKNIQTESQPLR